MSWTPEKAKRGRNLVVWMRAGEPRYARIAPDSGMADVLESALDEIDRLNIRLDLEWGTGYDQGLAAAKEGQDSDEPDTDVREPKKRRGRAA